MKLSFTKRRYFSWLVFYTGIMWFAVLTKDSLGILSVPIIFPYLVFIPGLLVLLALKIKSASVWLQSFYAVCLSLFMLMMIGLVANWLLPVFGVANPLSTVPLLNVFMMFMVSLLWWAAHKVEPEEKEIILVRGRIDWSYLMPVILIVLAVGGATRLNNGASNILTILLLLGIAADFFYLFRYCRRLPQSKILFHLFCIGLSLLLMTSLRGWFVTGHDVQREYHVFQLAKSQWHWEIASFRDPYNACLSITVLPTMFASLMKISDPYIYKVLFQILFALCPIGLYLLVQRISNRKLALLAVIYFMAFPTFFMDMPMLNRQELAFLFFTALLLLLCDNKSRYKMKVLLFGLFGAGIIFSHYSTTYAVLLIFVTACCIRFLFERRWFRHVADKIFHLFKRETPSFIGVRIRQLLVIIPMILGLALIAFLWNVQITKTSEGLADTVGNAAKSIRGNIQKDSRSSDTGASLFGGATLDPAVTLQKYETAQVQIRAETDADALYPEADLSENTINVAKDEPRPLTPIGRFISSFGIDIYKLNFVARQSYAKILQLLVLIGLGFVFFSKRLKLHPTSEYVAASIASIFFLTLLVFIPVLSVDYGLLRAFQQVLIVLALPTAIGSLALATLFTKKYAIGVTFSIAILFFLTSTGLLAELTGGYLAPLHLHNSGTYYDRYYVHAGEPKSIDWLARTVGEETVQADGIAEHRLEIFGKFGRSGELYPDVLQKSAYAYLGYTNIAKQTSYEIFKNEDVLYTYPVHFLDSEKNLLYSSQDARVYK